MLWACGFDGGWEILWVFRGHEEILHFVAQDEDRWGHIGAWGELRVFTCSMFSGYTAAMTVASSSCGTKEKLRKLRVKMTFSEEWTKGKREVQ